MVFLGTHWGFWWRAWLSLYGTLRGRRGSLDVMHEIAPTGLCRVTGMALRVTLRDFLRHAWLSLMSTLRGRRGALNGEYARDSIQLFGCDAPDSLYRPILRARRDMIVPKPCPTNPTHPKTRKVGI